MTQQPASQKTPEGPVFWPSSSSLSLFLPVPHYTLLITSLKKKNPICARLLTFYSLVVTKLAQKNPSETTYLFHTALLISASIQSAFWHSLLP